MYNLMCDPLGSLPNVFDDNLTDAELERFLLDVIARQSPGVQRLVARLRTPQGRQVGGGIQYITPVLVEYCNW